ncbi:hypothetical protein L596_013597 [Steinernema carpocapsae]|uniref:Saposin B-type domain-containing protein n=1 Tax=Steinernema carpocapsae TaxID=34508 RepID=A0A4U5P1H5_STECR|nr:hypothetical protein L596_013597 [Steinernema carpocapsae]
MLASALWIAVLVNFTLPLKPPNYDLLNFLIARPCPIPTLTCEDCILSVNYQQELIDTEGYQDLVKLVLESVCFYACEDSELCVPYVKCKFDTFNVTLHKYDSKTFCIMLGMCKETSTKFGLHQLSSDLCEKCLKTEKEILEYGDNPEFVAEYKKKEYQKCMNVVNEKDTALRREAPNNALKKMSFV